MSPYDDAPVRRVPNTNSDARPPDQPSDTISDLAWCPTRDLLAASSWDGTVQLWEVFDKGFVETQAVGAAIERREPVLSCCFSRLGGHLLTAGCDHEVWLRDLSTGQDQLIGEHTAPVKRVSVLDDLNLVVSGSWDKTIKLWDTQQRVPVRILMLPDRVQAMDVRYPHMVVACAGGVVHTYDLRTIGAATSPLRVDTNELKMVRSISLFSKSSGYVVGSIEGRCRVEYFVTDGQNLPFTFKACWDDVACFSVNAVDCHPQHNATFVTGGANGVVTTWDHQTKSRLKGFESVYYPITALRFSHTGAFLAYAAGYDWAQGEEPYELNVPQEIFVHKLLPEDVQPRRR